MKAMEAQLIWQMKRDEDKQRKTEQKQDDNDMMRWRQDRKQGLKEYAENRALTDKRTCLRDSYDFQEFKREAHVHQHQEELLDFKDEYEKTKEESDWQVELKRALPLEEQRLVVDQNLERYELLATYATQEAACEKMSIKETRQLNENLEFGNQLREARKERDEALKSLEYFRTQERAVVHDNVDIPTRPIVPNNRAVF